VPNHRISSISPRISLVGDGDSAKERAWSGYLKVSNGAQAESGKQGVVRIHQHDFANPGQTKVLVIEIQTTF
jgi:hypothetical protein